ncbi:MAG: glycosyltransferase [Bdellovibrionales bacterium]|nr:glycosyltransferase [Bdellovibrionales bacterium]
MKIAYISARPYPTIWVDTKQIIRTVEALCKLGVAVDLWLPKGALSSKSDEERRREIFDFYDLEAQSNLNIKFLRSFEPSKIDRKKYQFQLEKFFHGISAGLQTSKLNYDYIYSRDIFSVFLASKLKQKCIFECHKELAFQKKFQYLLLKNIKESTYLRGIVTNSKFIKDHFVKECHFSSKDTPIAYNGFDKANESGPLDRNQAKKLLGLDPQLHYIVYTGNQKKGKKGIEGMIELAKRLPEFSFIACGGDKTSVHYWSQYSQTLKLHNFKSLGWMDEQQIKLYQSAASFLLIPPTLAPLEKTGNTVTPIKVFSYLAMERPILAPDSTDIVEVLSHNKNSILLPPDDYDNAAQIIKNSFEDKTLLEIISKQARTDSKKYTWDARAKIVYQFLLDKKSPT